MKMASTVYHVIYHGVKHPAIDFTLQTKNNVYAVRHILKDEKIVRNITIDFKPIFEETFSGNKTGMSSYVTEHQRQLLAKMLNAYQSLRQSMDYVLRQYCKQEENPEDIDVIRTYMKSFANLQDKIQIAQHSLNR